MNLVPSKQLKLNDLLVNHIAFLVFNDKEHVDRPIVVHNIYRLLIQISSVFKTLN